MRNNYFAGMTRLQVAGHVANQRRSLLDYIAHPGVTPDMVHFVTRNYIRNVRYLAAMPATPDLDINLDGPANTVARLTGHHAADRWMVRAYGED